MGTLKERLERAVADKGLSIGDAWNLLSEALDRIERLEARESQARCARCGCEAFLTSGQGLEPTEYGCHVDLDPGQKPDECVMDCGDYDECRIASKLHRDGKGKEACEYWQPVKFAALSAQRGGE